MLPCGDVGAIEVFSCCFAATPSGITTSASIGWIARSACTCARRRRRRQRLLLGRERVASLITDNGAEFAVLAFERWAHEYAVSHRVPTPGPPEPLP